MTQQYAALPWRKVERFEILLITSRQSGRWIIPKGWPMPGHTGSEAAAQEAYEEAGIRGQIAPEVIGCYSYTKRLEETGNTLLRVDVFEMEVTEVLDLWPEVHQRKRQWFSPAEAAVRIYEPELAIIIRTFAQDQFEQALPALTSSQVLWQKLKALLRI